MTHPSKIKNLRINDKYRLQYCLAAINDIIKTIDYNQKEIILVVIIILDEKSITLKA